MTPSLTTVMSHALQRDVTAAFTDYNEHSAHECAKLGGVAVRCPPDPPP